MKTLPELDSASIRRLEGLKRTLYSAARQRSYARDMELIGRCMREILAFPPSMHVYNIILKANIMLENVEGVKSILNMIKEERLSFNNITFNLLISYYRKAGRPLEAEFVAQEMIEKGIEPDRISLTTLVATFSNSDLPKAEKYFAMMDQSASPTNRPDIYAYNALIGGYMHHGIFSKSAALVAEMDKKGVIPNIITFKIFIECLLRHGKKSEARCMWETAEALFPSMPLEDVSEICYQFFNHEEAEQGLLILRSMQAKFGSAIGPSCIKAALRHAISTRNHDLFLHYFDGFVQGRERSYQKFFECRYPASVDWNTQVYDRVTALLEVEKK